jgi:hypothetical protein
MWDGLEFLPVMPAHVPALWRTEDKIWPISIAEIDLDRRRDGDVCEPNDPVHNMAELLGRSPCDQQERQPVGDWSEANPKNFIRGTVE